MKKILLGTFIATILLVSLPQLSLAQTTLYGGIGRGVPTNRGALITINQGTGTGTLVGPGAGPIAGLTGLAFDISGKLYGSAINAPFEPTTLVRINPVTGAEEASVGITRLSDGTPLVITDLAVQPGTDVLFGTALDPTTFFSNIYTIDKSTGIATFIGNTGVIGATLAFGPDGTLYQTSAEFDSSGAFVRGFLLTLDPATAAVLTTSDPFFQAHVGGLAVRPTDGKIFATGGMPGDVYKLSARGRQTLLGFTGLGGVGDVAFTPLPTDECQCKNSGWRRFNFPFSFRNQRDCLRFVERERDDDEER
jgi:hypothetical protein